MNGMAILPVTLPDELIQEILLRLPIQYVLQCKCVCKSWLSLISDPQFAKSHFDLAATPTYRFLNVIDNILLRSIDIETPFDDVSATIVSNGALLPLIRNSSSPKVCIVGSCKGFILLHRTNTYWFSDFMIWNPSTGFHTQITNNAFMFPQLCGLGYDLSTNDYLIVRVTMLREQRSVVDFFSLRNNSWGVSESTVTYHCCNNFSFIHGFTHNGEFLNEALHWLVKSSDMLQVIIAFDVREKRLSDIPVPHDLAIAFEYELSHFRVIGECLCVNFMKHGTQLLEMWMMKEYKVQSSWTKSFVLSINHDPLVSIFYPMCFTKNGEIFGTDGGAILARFNDKGKLLDHHTDEFNSFESRNCCIYRESLLSLPEILRN